MTDVDPFIHPIPPEFLQKHETRAWVEYLHRFLHDLWQRTGGGDDVIQEIIIGELYEPGIQISNSDEFIDELEGDIDHIESLVYSSINSFSESIGELEASVTQIEAENSSAITRIDAKIEDLEASIELLSCKVHTEEEQGHEFESVSFVDLHERVEELEIDVTHIEAIASSAAAEAAKPEFTAREMATGDTSLTLIDGENVIITCFNTAAGTIDLGSPTDGQRVKIKRKDALITLTGTVDGVTNPSLLTKYDAVEVIYSATAGEWGVF